ncbi:DUF6382 domain-containing protein [Heyndrickxia vini]|uniref:FHA domain-containing protein n=1 Tax=Heyndrickxia vini TaxID=1476025 RepID=A0ABX7E6L7_9BACI|nr:DUF6382 domain-containing protein [Heyndrickxia vini]QQZ10437.1 FHA domain-containing protein [Heyndrickxia vini]
MKSSIYGIGYDFYQKNGHYLMLYENQGEQLLGDALIPLQVKMMQSNQIPNILPLSIEELDFNIRLYYDITSKRNLQSYLDNHTLSSFDFYQLFINIITTLEQSKLYMLNEHHYILKEDFIFIGKEVKQLYLTYLPIQSFEKKSSTLDELKELLLRIVKQVESLQGSEQKHISQYVEDPSFSLAGLKELLIDLQRLRPTPYTNYQNGLANQSIHSNQMNTGVQGNYANQPNAISQQSSPVQNQEVKTDSQPPAKKKTKETLKKEKRGSAFTQRQKVYIIVLGLLALTIIWKIFEAVPTQMMLLVCTVLSVAVLVIGAILLLKKGQSTLAASEAAASNQATENPNFQQNVPLPVGAMNNQAFVPNPQQSQSYYGGSTTNIQTATNIMEPPAVPPMTQTDSKQAKVEKPIRIKQTEQKKLNPIREEQSFSLDTNLLVENDDTVLLADEMDDDFVQPIVEPYLEVDRNGEVEHIKLTEDHFMIGRNEAAVDYVEDSVGISRVHLELIKIDNSYGVKDLGSRNGTKLNGETLIPYKIYALNEDDCLTIGKVEYRFKWE